MIGVLMVSLGMTGQGCPQFPVVPGLSLAPPAIIPTIPTEETLLRRFTVDLRDYPETDGINWDFGDGAMIVGLPVSEGRAITHEFTGAGTYDVSVYLFSAPDPVNGISSTLIATGSLPVDVVAPNKMPVAAFVIEEVLDEDGLPVSLSKRFVASRSRDPDGTIEAYEWDFGDGSHAEGKIVEHDFSHSARFVVRLTVVDDRGGRDSTTRTILANTTPVASFAYTEDPNNALRFTFDASGSSDSEGVIAQYEWDFGDDSAQETGVVVSHTYAVPDDFTVRLTVTDEVGEMASTSQVVNVTGSEPFVRSVSPDVGEMDTSVSDIVIDGENFEDGATVRLERGGDAIAATSVTVESETTLRVAFDLSGADVGDYTLVVSNPDGATAQLVDGFRVVTPNLVRLTTDLGDILLELVDDAPVTTANFLQYVEDGFYDGTIFHRVVPDFVVQGGGFLPGMVQQEGIRDPIVNEFSPDRSNLRSTVAMAKLGDDPDSATSQFFVNLADNSENLDNQNGGFTVFANVIEGMDVVDAIAAVPLDGEVPIDDVLLIRARRE